MLFLRVTYDDAHPGPEELRVTMDRSPRFVRFRHLVIVTAFEQGGRSLYIRLHARIGTSPSRWTPRWLHVGFEMRLHVFECALEELP